MKQININVEDEVLEEASSILNDFGMDCEMVYKILLKRIIRDRNISFLFPKTSESNIQVSNDYHGILNANNIEYDKMTKSRAVRLFINEGIEVKGKVIFSSKNRSVANYWANPPLYVLDVDTSLILNDTINKKLYLFFIPACSFSKSQLITRSDQPELIDLQIRYNDPSFEDNRSGMKFSKYLKNIINY